MKREDYGENKERNIEEKIFVIFKIIFKTKQKEKKTHGY